ncbi:MAG: hypothetical protein KUG83_10005 [Gammaproteobacteria bacterium]|nr:hypothetical protein [Gammaproteobacteria bacterium]
MTLRRKNNIKAPLKTIEVGGEEFDAGCRGKNNRALGYVRDYSASSRMEK